MYCLSIWRDFKSFAVWALVSWAASPFQLSNCLIRDPVSGTEMTLIPRKQKKISWQISHKRNVVVGYLVMI